MVTTIRYSCIRAFATVFCPFRCYSLGLVLNFCPTMARILRAPLRGPLRRSGSSRISSPTSQIRAETLDSLRSVMMMQSVASFFLFLGGFFLVVSSCAVSRSGTRANSDGIYRYLIYLYLGHLESFVLGQTGPTRKLRSFVGGGSRVLSWS